MMRKMMDAVKGKTLINEQDDPFDPATIDKKKAEKLAADKAASDKAAADKAAIPKPVTTNLKKTYNIGGQDITFKYPQLSKDGGKTQEDKKNSPIIIRGPKGYVLIDKKTHKVTGDPKKSFYIYVKSTPNGSMMTAWDDFIKYVNRELKGNVIFKPYDGDKSSASVGTIENSLTLLPQYYETNEGQTKDFNITDNTKKDANGNPYIWKVRVKYADYVDGNGVLKKKIVNNIMWIDVNGAMGEVVRPNNFGTKDWWYDGEDLTDGNYTLPGKIVTELDDLIGDEIWKPKRIYGSKVSQDPGPGYR
jgi:hypothetical protein